MTKRAKSIQSKHLSPSIMFFGLFGVDKEKESHHHEHSEHEASDISMSNEPLVSPEDIGQVALDVLENDESVVLIAPLAGVPKDAVDINLSRNILTISGKRERPKNLEGRSLVSECFFGAFSRSVILPEHLALNKVRATMEDNLLVITIPKLVIGSKSVKIERFSSTSASQ